MDVIAMLAITLALVAYGLISRKIEGSILTGPTLFTVFGLVAGPAALGLIPLQMGNEALHLLVEVTLILVLFSDAANIDLAQLRRDHNLPVRMLLVGMPLTIALGAVAAWLLFDGFGLLEAALLAAILAPTNAALGQAVVSNRLVPVRIRQALNVESGLNDGIALPFVLIFAAFASAMHAETVASEWLLFGVKQVVFGPLAGIAVGYVGAKLVARCYRTQWMSEGAEGMIALGLAFGAFALAEVVEGNGFIAALVAGLTFGNTLKQKCLFLYEFAESEGQILILLTFMAFGAAMIPQAIDAVTINHIFFAILALTVLRMLPIHLSLLGTGIKPVTSAFLGWFGPPAQRSADQPWRLTPALLPSTAHRQPFLSIEPLDTLPVNQHAFTPKLVVDEPVAPAHPLSRDLPNPSPELLLGLPHRLIPNRRAWKACEPHGSTL